jgi:hypothetical protein
MDMRRGEDVALTGVRLGKRCQHYDAAKCGAGVSIAKTNVCPRPNLDSPQAGNVIGGLVRRRLRASWMRSRCSSAVRNPKTPEHLLIDVSSLVVGAVGSSALQNLISGPQFALNN